MNCRCDSGVTGVSNSEKRKNVVKIQRKGWRVTAFLTSQNCDSTNLLSSHLREVAMSGVGGWGEGGTVGQDVVELICQNARKTRQNEAIAL